MPDPTAFAAQSLGQIDYTALLLALVLGGVIGLEREINGRPAGLRTHILVCLSATILILVSRAVAGTSEGLADEGRIVFDPNRMGAGIVTGIGFLGAATVIRSGDLLRGLTTAACIWFVAGLGIVLGSGYYLLGTVATAVVLVVLTVVNKLAAGIPPVQYRRLIVMVRQGASQALVADIRQELRALGLRVIDIASGHDNDGAHNELVFYLSLKQRHVAPAVTERIAALDGVSSARWTLIHSP
ncbi:MAG: MgtC/SapB family protein [Planctomycetota bacterium]